jgi:hypothetical protein
MSEISGVGVLDKSVALLAALAERGPLNLAGLVEATGLPRPTAHRLAAALETHRLVGRDAAGRYRLGLRLLGWAGAASAEVGLVEVARPVLAALAEETGESAQLFVRDGDRRVCVAAVERASGLRDTVPVGSVLPLDRGSGGKVLLAFDWLRPAGRASSTPCGAEAGRPAWPSGKRAWPASAPRCSTPAGERGRRCASAAPSSVSAANPAATSPPRWWPPPGRSNAALAPSPCLREMRSSAAPRTVQERM